MPTIFFNQNDLELKKLIIILSAAKKRRVVNCNDRVRTNLVKKRKIILRSAQDGNPITRRNDEKRFMISSSGILIDFKPVK